MSVCRSVRPSVTVFFFGVFGVFEYSCPNAWVRLFHHCPCPPARDFGGCVSGLVLFLLLFFYSSCLSPSPFFFPFNVFHSIFASRLSNLGSQTQVIPFLFSSPLTFRRSTCESPNVTILHFLIFILFHLFFNLSLAIFYRCRQGR